MGVESSFNAHFPEIDLGECDLSAMGFSHASISVFDHWLTEDEAESCSSMSYSISLDAGSLEDYLVGEKKFLQLYRSLGEHGVICNRPGPLRKLTMGDEHLEQILTDSLREKRLMDVYFVDYGVRVIGGYDRTDLIIADSHQQLAFLSAQAGKCGLFVLPSK